MLPEQTLSIVDELKNRGFTLQSGERLPLFNVRSNLYQQSGLDKTLGSFTGTGIQNTKLLDYVRSNNITFKAPAAPAPPVVSNVSGGNSTATGVLATAGSSSPSRLPTADELGIPKRLTESDILSRIPQQPGTSAQDVLNTASGGLTASIAQEQGSAALAAGETKAQTTAEKFGSAGLYFSGARVSAEGAVRAEALSNKLKIDAGLAKFIVQRQEQGDKETATKITQIVKDAVSNNDKSRTEAISALGGLGYVVMPDGTIVQKPSEARAAEDQRFQQEGQIRAEAREERAMNAADRAVASETRAQARFETWVNEQKLGATATERLRVELSGQFSQISNVLSQDSVIGRDGYLNPQSYLQARTIFSSKYPDKVGLFDQTFSYKLNPNDRDRLGIGKVPVFNF